ncbi:sigma-70 family RNA polymerase sigma factor [Agrobacterium sp. CG674]
MDPKNRPFDVIGQLSSLRRYARSLVRSTSDADDLVQDALVKAYERQRTFKSDGNLRHWLLSILHNTHIDRHRSASARQRSDDIVSSDAALSYPAPQEQSAYLSQVKDAFMRLPDEQREALHLVAIEDLSYQEAAETLGIPVGTLMSRVSRARAALRSGEMPNQPRNHLKIVGGGHD